MWYEKDTPARPNGDVMIAFMTLSNLQTTKLHTRIHQIARTRLIADFQQATQGRDVKNRIPKISANQSY
jgi:hypothetical protein